MDTLDYKPKRLIRAAEVYDRTALSRASFWRRVKAGAFPKPVTLGYNRIAWVESEIDAWIDEQRSNPPAPARRNEEPLPPPWDDLD